jgi:DNA-binding beta-propeller fold protein YncE
MEVLMQRVWLILAALALGCGSSQPPPQQADGGDHPSDGGVRDAAPPPGGGDAAPADGGGDAAPADGGGDAAAAPHDQRAVIALKDGNLSVVNLATDTVTKKAAPAMAVATDAILRAGDGVIYVVNRYGFDNLVVLDATDYHVVTQISTGAGSNPQDVAVAAANRLYVPLYASGKILILDPSQSAGHEAVGSVDLTGIDPTPTPGPAVFVGGQVLVALGFIDQTTYAARRAGMIVVIDPQTDTITARFDMQSENPFNRLAPVPGSARAVVDGAADFGGTAGCFELVDVAAQTSTCVVTNATCGGWSGAPSVAPEGDVYAAVAAGFSADGTVCHFKLDGTVVRTGITATGASFTDLAVDDRGDLLVGDVKTPGLWVYDRATDGLRLTAPLDLGDAPQFADGILLLP